LRNTIRAIALAAFVAAGAAHAAQPVSSPPASANPIVWDKGPSTGPAGDAWSNQTAGQNFADSVTLAHTTFITGFNYFTVLDLSGDNASDAFHLKVLADAGGQPGAYLTQEDIGFQAVTSIVGGIEELSFQFAPIEFTAGTTYWVGLSGNGFEAAQLSVLDPGFDGMAQFDGASFDFMATGANGFTDVGDQMFQLTGVVPEPANIALMAAGLALVGFAVRRRRRA
jgi:hypothetical protein